MTSTNIFTQIEADLSKAWGAVENIVETDAVEVWNDFRSILTSLVPAQFTILKTFILRALADVASGDIGDIETALLNDAEAQEIAWLKNLGSSTLQAVIATVKAANHAPVANTVAH